MLEALGGELLTADGQDVPTAGARNEAVGTISVTLRANGKSYSLQLDPRVTLLDALRGGSG